MKVIVAGFVKTGTKSLNAALGELGYNVYDFMEHFWFHEKQWRKVLTLGGGAEDFKEMYRDVDAVVDAPSFPFWEEIHEAFPDAKIILTMRDEDTWVDSLVEQFETSANGQSLLSMLYLALCPTGRRFMHHALLYMPICVGNRLGSFFEATIPNKLLLKRRFREHNCYVLQNAPKDKLLVFNVKEGWEPLCKFLGKDVPNSQFPWKNKNGTAITSIVENHHYTKQVQKELFIICTCVVLLIAVLLYFLL